MDPAEEARLQLSQCRVAMANDSDLAIYAGTSDLLERFIAGAVVNSHDAMTDESLWTVRPIHHKQLERLKWMLKH